MSFPRYPAYKDSGVEWLGEVPEHWCTGRLAYLLDLLVDGTHHSPESWPEGDFKYVTAKNIKEHGFDFSELAYIAVEDHHQIFARCPVRRDDVLYIKDGATAGIAMVNLLDEEFSLLSSVALIRSKQAFLAPKYAAYHLNAGQFKKSVLQYLIGGAMTRFTLDMISRFSFAIPTLPEQLSIATFLDRETAKIDALIAEQQRLIELLQEKRQAVISHAVTKGLDPDAPMKDSGVEWLGEVPEHWLVCNFQRFVEIAEGQVDPRQSPFADMPLIAPNHIQSGTGQLLDLETAAVQGAESGKYICNEGDVIYSKIRPALRKACIAPCACLTSADMYPLRAHGRLSNEFLFRFLLSEPFSALAIVESERVAMPKINRDSLKSVALAIPPISEQEDICQFISVQSTTFDPLMVGALEAIDLLSERRSALISAAVTGQIDVRGLAPDEAAA